mgnify:CR=1 FL=1
MPYNTPEKLKAYLERTKAKRAEKKREYRQNNKEDIAEKRREYDQNNKEKNAEYQREYKENNKEQIAEYQREYHKIFNQTPAGKKAWIMSNWRRRGVVNVNDEMYERYLNTTKCECCLKEFSCSTDRCLDHNHETGEFRWVICRSCNNQDYWKKKINKLQGC